MITVSFRSGPLGANSFLIKGHANSGEYGKDIVCASVSSAVYLTANTITEILHTDCKIIERDGYFSLSLKEESPSATAMLEGLRLHLSELSKDYPRYVSLTTEV